MNEKTIVLYLTLGELEVINTLFEKEGVVQGPTLTLQNKVIEATDKLTNECDEIEFKDTHATEPQYYSEIVAEITSLGFKEYFKNNYNLDIRVYNSIHYLNVVTVIKNENITIFSLNTDKENNLYFESEYIDEENNAMYVKDLISDLSIADIIKLVACVCATNYHYISRRRLKVENLPKNANFSSSNKFNINAFKINKKDTL